MTTIYDDVTADLSGVYLKKQDLADGPLRLTISEVERVTFEARAGKPAEPKWVLTFAGEPVRKLGLCKTNLAVLAKAFGRKVTPWIGQTIEVYLDQSVMFAGQLTGGIRVRIPKPARRSAPAHDAVIADPDLDDPLPDF
jgi:hypothetical protein